MNVSQDEKVFYQQLAEKADQEMSDIGCTAIYLRDLSESIQNNLGQWFSDEAITLIQKAQDSCDDVVIGYFLNNPIIAN